jgi:hypothetical protein
MRLLRERREETEARVEEEDRAAARDLAAVVREAVAAEAEERLAAGEAGGFCDSR